MRGRLPWRQAIDHRIVVTNQSPDLPSHPHRQPRKNSSSSPIPHPPPLHTNGRLIALSPIMSSSSNPEYFYETRVNRWAIVRYLEFCLAEASQNNIVYNHNDTITRWLTSLAEYAQLKTSTGVRASKLLSTYYAKVCCLFAFLGFIGANNSEDKPLKQMVPYLAHWTTVNLLGCLFSAPVGLVIVRTDIFW